jgi:NAD-dependent deacetylase
MYDPHMDGDGLDRFARLLRDSCSAVFFTGAGMSTESGLPDFRSSGGLWRENRRFEELASVESLDTDFDEFVAFYRWRIEMLARFHPHRGHERIAAWQREGRVRALVTQNVDGFHEAAGSPSVINLHGTMARIRCRDCGDEQPAARYLVDEGTRCGCGGRMRPAVVLFGEMLPADALQKAGAATARADLFVVLGSSLLVSPANSFPLLAKRSGAKLAIVNRDPTPLDGIADVVLDGSIGDVLESVAARL